MAIIQVVSMGIPISVCDSDPHEDNWLNEFSEINQNCYNYTGK